MVQAIRTGREKETILLLPTHRLLARAREEILAESGVAGAGHLNVWSFYQFTMHVLSLAGVRREPMDDALRRFILHNLLREARRRGSLPRLTRLAGSLGVTAALDRLIGQLKLARVGPGALAEALKGLLAAEPGMAGEAAALAEAAELYACYQVFLAERDLADKEELLVLAYQTLRDDPQLLGGVTLLVGGFYELTPLQADILQAVAERAERVEVVLAAATDLPEPEEMAVTAVLTRTPGSEREVRQIAKDLKRLLQEGVRPEEIAVLMADPAAYDTLFAEVFTEEGIPCDRAGEEPLDRSPVVRSMLLCLEAAAGLDQGFDLFKLARSGYLPGDEAILGALRRVFPRRGYRYNRLEWERRLGAALAWQERLAGDDEDDRRAEHRAFCDELRRALALLPALLDPLAVFPRQADLAGYRTALERLTQDLHLSERTLSSEGPEEVRIRDWAALQAFREVVDRLARAGNLLPDAGELTLPEFLRTLRAALTEATYRTEAAWPGGVALLPVSQSVGLEFPYVFYVGVRDGVVPRPVREDWLLPEALRRALAARGLRLETAEQLASRERFLFQLGVTRATKRLYLSYPESDPAGRPQLGSPFLLDFARRFAGGMEQRRLSVREVVPPLKEVSTPRELLLRVVREWWRPGGPAEAVPAVVAAGQLLFRENPERWRRVGYAAASLAQRLGPATGLAQAQRTAWAGWLADQGALDLLASRHSPSFRWSARSFGEYCDCPFRYFLQRELLAPPVEELGEELTPLDRGLLYHDILRRYYRQGGAAVLERGEDAREAALRAVTAEVFAASPARELLPHPLLWEMLRERAVRDLWRVVAEDVRRRAATGSQPAFLEWGFGLRPNAELDPRSAAEPLRLPTPAGELVVTGKVDRIDRDGDGRFVVYDYKTGRTAPRWQDEREGRSLQLRLYLRAVAGLLLPEAEAAGAAYYLVEKGEAREGLWCQERAEALVKHNRRRVGLLPLDEWERMMAGTAEVAGEIAERVRRGEFPVAPLPGRCQRCRYSPACRVDETAGGVGGAEE
jgi:ATP-dependent helicase/DNAse subunit B